MTKMSKAEKDEALLTWRVSRDEYFLRLVQEGMGAATAWVLEIKPEARDKARGKVVALVVDLAWEVMCQAMDKIGRDEEALRLNE